MRNPDEIGFWHLTLTSKGRMRFFPDEAKLRQAVRKLAKTTAPYLVSFCIVDDHIHLVVCCSKSTVARLPRTLYSSLSSISPCRFQERHLIPIEERAHLERLINYTVKQPWKHGLTVHPALYSGSSFLDLVGARSIGVLGYPIASALPRFNLEQLFHEVNLPTRSLTPIDDEQMKTAGMEAILRAASAVFAVDPALQGKSAETVMARRTTVRLAKSVGFTTAQVSCQLQRCERSVYRLLNDHPVPDETLTAVRRYLALERLISSSGG